MLIYCLHCKKKQEIKDTQLVTMKNGRSTYTGKCPQCGYKVSQFTKNKPEDQQRKIGPIKIGSKFKWKLLAPGVALAILGIGMMLLYGQDRHNVFFAFMTISALPAGVYMIYRGLKGGEAGIILPEGGEQAKTTGPVNSLNIYPDRVVFEYTEAHKGQPQQCLNDSKYYYVHKFNPETKDLELFVLPDKYDYYDPKEYANVLEVRAWRKLNERIASLWQKVAPGVLVIALIISGIIFIATTGGE